MTLQDMLQCSGCDVQHKINQCYSLLGSWDILRCPSFSLYGLKKIKILTLSKKPWYKSWKSKRQPYRQETETQKQKHKKSCQEPNGWQKQTTAAQYRVCDVEVLSDLFLRERLHVPHRLDVVPPEVGFVLRQSQRLQPCVRVPAKINTTCWGPLS